MASKPASLEPAYILGDRRLIPEAANAVESVLRTELLEATPKTMADSCMPHGYCAAELIIWYDMKQLILPPDVNEVTMQKEILTPPKIPPSALDQASKWLEEVQHRLNLCVKTKQHVHPQTLVAFVTEALSAVVQYYRTIGNIWDSLYAKHQLETPDRHYSRSSVLHALWVLDRVEARWGAREDHPDSDRLEQYADEAVCTWWIRQCQQS